MTNAWDLAEEGFQGARTGRIQAEEANQANTPKEDREHNKEETLIEWRKRVGATTTNLEEVRQGAPFTWGEIKNIWDIGPYTVAAYIERSSLNLHYHVWVDGENTSHGAISLEGALAEAMAVKWDGVNSQAAMFFMRMIGVEE